MSNFDNGGLGDGGLQAAREKAYVRKEGVRDGEELKTLLDKLFLECEHGDEEHRKWLRDKFDDFITKNILKT